VFIHVCDKLNQCLHRNLLTEILTRVNDVLKVNSYLTTLHLNGNDMGNEGASAIADALKVISSLWEIIILIGAKYD
jgi:hypothetical protein